MKDLIIDSIIGLPVVVIVIAAFVSLFVYPWAILVLFATIALWTVFWLSMIVGYQIRHSLWFKKMTRRLRKDH